MKRQAMAVCLALLTAAVLSSLIPQQGSTAGANEERIYFALPSLKAEKMPPVLFSHDRHVTWMESANQDCIICHVDGASGMSEYFMNSENMVASNLVPYIHKECVGCHASVKSDKPSGPPLASCRSCHSESNVKAQTAAKQK